MFTGTAITSPVDFDDAQLGENNLALVVIDTLQNGFADDINMGLTVGDSIALDTFLPGSDDLIVARNSSGIIWQSFIPGSANFVLGNGISPGDPFAIFFFNNLADTSTAVLAGTHYGVATDATWKVPSDGSSIGFLASPGLAQFQQLSGSKTIYSVAIPEPTSLPALLAFWLGCASLRRRRSIPSSPVAR